jgi:hypothetical protein
MARRGRPPSPRSTLVRVVNIKLRLYPGEDDDLMAFFSNIPDRLRAVCVKTALRSGTQQGPLLCDAEQDALADALDGLVL